METSVLLLLLFSVFVYGIRQQLGQDFFQALFYFYLFVYGIFALIGYVYRPQVSELISAYFGPDIADHAIIFILLSILSVSLGLKFISPAIAKSGQWLEISQLRFNYTAVTLLMAGLVIAGQASGLLIYWNKLSYINASDVDFIESTDIGYKIWFIFYLTNKIFLVIFFALLRYRYWTNPVSCTWLLLAGIVIASLFFVTVYRVANRGEILSLFNAVLMVEYIRHKNLRLSIRSLLLKVLVFAIAVIIYGEMAKNIRGGNESAGLDWLGQLVYQDYYAPAHMLFAAISYNMIDPLLVIKSNSASLLPGAGVPYLQQYVTDLFNPGFTTRASSYAFYILSEGYIFCGDIGFLYNAVVIACGVGLWRLLSNTRYLKFNALLLPILALDAANLSRGQSSYFIKVIYFHFIPALLVIFATTGYFYSGIRRSR